MGSSAFAGMETVFNRATNTSSPYSFAAVGDVLAITPPNRTRKTIDVTPLADDVESIIAGVRGNGVVKLRLNFVEANYVLFQTDLTSSSTRRYQIELSDTGTTTIEFAAFVTELSQPEIGKDGQVQFEVTMALNGDPVYAA